MILNNLPKKIAIFPLSNAVFFPKTVLPLNIFEERYIQLVSDCMKDKRLFGMVQPKFQNEIKSEVYTVGCLGKITSFSETKDNRFTISLSGIIRFRIIEEVSSSKLYREFTVDYTDFAEDLKAIKNEEKSNNKKNILKKVKTFFKKKNYLVDLGNLEELNFDQLMSTICMISPFSVEEKQKLIETISIEEKIKIFEDIIDFNLVDYERNNTIQ